MKKRKKGFTLIELIIVVAIIGILAAIAVPKFNDVQKKSKISADIASAKVIADAATLYYAENGKTTKTVADKEVDIVVADLQLQSIPVSQLYKNEPFILEWLNSNPIVKVGEYQVYPKKLGSQYYPNN